ncbi:MAG: bifunctional aldolase/short-chain dehydrogenase [Myxococcota bacterium]|nr:bifunctional aldolase/short-chain dehydrogenase [Myxococcota bacterium]
MQSRWNDSEARQAVDRWASEGGPELALRVYTSRLIGVDPELVLHGGGNTSLKSTRDDILGEPLEVLHVKGSGSALDSVAPRDLPGLDLARLRRLRSLPALSDEEMVNQLRTHLLDATSPNPSVETLLHAFLPHRYVDHSHADAVLALTNQPDGEALAREALGDRVVVIPYVMPGFPLALAVADAAEAHPSAEGAVLLKHGLFTFADDARESYERHIEFVSCCEAVLAKRAEGRPRLRARAIRMEDEPAEQRVAEAAPILRGLLAERGEDPEVPAKPLVMEWRGDEATRAFCESEEALRLVTEGPLTPDHVIRTKALPLFVPQPSFGDGEALARELSQEVGRYRGSYDAYFEACVASKGVVRTKLDSAPRVVLLPGAGALCFGRTKKDARIAADITEHTLAAKALAEAAGHYEALAADHLFDMEYWSLEQAKLGKAKDRPLESRIVFVTGGAGAIAQGIAEACAEAGGHVVLADLDEEGARAAASRIEERHGAGSAKGIGLDVTDGASVREAFDACCVAYGGVDVVVPNAGLAHVAPIRELEPGAAQRVSDVNYMGVLHTLREAGRLFELQGIGGDIVVNASKNVFAPGKDFGAYSASKAAATQLGKIAALELAPLDVRVNFINADAIFEGGGRESGLWAEVGPERAARRGLSPDQLPEFYRDRNLLKSRVRARHVGNAVVFFASRQTPTTGATLPVDGGIPEAFPR